MILDSSAIVAIIFQEPGYETVWPMPPQKLPTCPCSVSVMISRKLIYH